MSPNSYSTPRTVEPGEVSHSLALEADVSRAKGTVYEDEVDEHVGFAFPAYTARWGLLDHLDGGLRLGGAVGLDLKHHFVEATWIDVAYNPTIRWTLADRYVFHAILPVLFGFNVHRRLTLTATGGVVVSHELDDQEQDIMNSSQGILARIGVGLDWRLNPGLAIHPEISAHPLIADLPDPKQTSWHRFTWSFGIAVNYGHLPDYD